MEPKRLNVIVEHHPHGPGVVGNISEMPLDARIATALGSLTTALVARGALLASGAAVATDQDALVYVLEQLPGLLPGGGS